MKKTYSIFIIVLILYLSVININPAHAVILGNNYNKVEHTYSNKKMNTGYSNLNIEYTNLNNENNSEVLEVFNHNAKQLYITGEDIDLMAKLVYAESIGEPYDGKVAVASVVLNRTVNSKFPNTIKGVIFQKNAFSCVRNGQIKAAPNQDCYNAVYDAIKGNDPTNEALFFYNPRTATCNWMKKAPKVNEKTIGHHIFFRLKS